jgi:hypothetical protein
VLVHPGDDCHGIRRELEQLLDERFAIDHTTLQVDPRARTRSRPHRRDADDAARTLTRASRLSYWRSCRQHQSRPRDDRRT